MSLYSLAGPGSPGDPGDLIAPVLIAAFDGWVDAGSAATSALEQLLDDAVDVATFDPDALFDYRARRPTLQIVDGRLAELTWPELVVRRVRFGERDLLVLAGPEPDDRWHAFADDMLDLARRLGVVEWVSLGAIPAAVPHTRDVPILGRRQRKDAYAATSSRVRPACCACRPRRSASSRWRWPRAASRQSATSRRSRTTSPARIPRRR